MVPTSSARRLPITSTPLKVRKAELHALPAINHNLGAEFQFLSLSKDTCTGHQPRKEYFCIFKNNNVVEEEKGKPTYNEPPLCLQASF
jgi:hypothetical protein